MFEYDFDLNNNMTKFAALTPHGSNVTQYTYGADNLPATSTFSNGKNLAYVFDTVCLPKLVEINTTTPIKTEYTYFRVDGSSFDKLTDVVRTEKSGAFNYRYKYNKNYSITEILETVTDENNVSTESVIENYTYDALDQLTQAVDYKHNKKYVYTYNGGNITEEKIYDISGSSEVLSKTNTYSYDDASWGDLLTAYNGQAITYDEIGNPLKYRDDIDLTWSNGRQLSSYTKGDTTVEYTYDTDGMRLTKKIGNTNYTYLYEGGLLVQETRGNEIFDYSYDANGCIRMLAYRATEGATPTYYYYALNSRSDVVGLYNSSGAVYAKYTYDPWGNITSVTNASGTAITDTNNIAHTQPFRYRSYYYDTDSNLYYVSSRYYDPVTHRFINADGLVSTGTGVLGHNMFAYCDNNPVNYTDSSGGKPKSAHDIQVEIANGNSNYNIMDVTRMQMGYAGTTNSGKSVYVVSNPSDNVPSGDNIVVVDYRNWNDPNMQIRDSYLITDFVEMGDIANILLEYNEDNTENYSWSRTVNSIIIEWDAHNDLYNISDHERLKHVDLNNADEGTTYIEFVIRAGKEVIGSVFR